MMTTLGQTRCENIYFTNVIRYNASDFHMLIHSNDAHLKLSSLKHVKKVKYMYRIQTNKSE